MSVWRQHRCGDSRQFTQSRTRAAILTPDSASSVNVNPRETLPPCRLKERHDNERCWITETSEADHPVAALRQVAKTFADEYLTKEGLDRRQIALQTWSEAQINPPVLSSVREGLDGLRTQLAQLIRRGQAAKRLTSELDADSIAQTLIALFYGR